MEFEFSKKADSFQAGIFAILNEKKEEMVKAGKKVYNLSVGTPDFKPAPHIMEAVSEAAKDPENYKYALTDRPFLLEAVQNFYKRRFGVSIEPEEIMTINGSQEGMAHIAWQSGRCGLNSESGVSDLQHRSVSVRCRCAYLSFVP